MAPQPPPAYGEASPLSSQALWGRVDREFRETYGLSKDEAKRMAYEAAVLNEALRFMDPTTRGQYLRQMSRDYPGLIGRGGPEGEAFAGAAVPTPPSGRAAQSYREQLLAQQRLSDAIAALAPAAIKGATTGEAKPIGKGFAAPMEFLGDYLRTAQQAYGTGVGRQTRAQRAYAEQRLRELAQQAEQRPEYALMATLGQDLVNPVMSRAPVSGGLGTSGATVYPGGTEIKQGTARRNIALT